MNPAQILATYLTAEGVFTPNFPVVIDGLQDTPDDLCCFYNTSGVLDGRLSRTGLTVEHPGIEVRLRGKKNPQAYQKIRQVQTAVQAIHNVSAVVTEGQTSTTYLINAVKRQGGIMFIGLDERKRPSYTLNLTLTLQ